jgi:hypothetical protein
MVKISKKSGKLILPAKSLYKKYKSRLICLCPNVWRLKINNNGLQVVWGSLGLEYLTEIKRRNFCCTFSNFDLLPNWKGDHITKSYLQMGLTNEQ